MAATCEAFPGTHTANDVAAKTIQMIRKFGVEEKNVACCVTDNEPTMNAAADLMPFQWMGCIDHLIELVTGIAFDGPGVQCTMKNARTLVGYFTSSSQHLAQLLDEQRIISPNKDPLKPIQDIETRWWSTYSMVSRLLELKDAIMALKGARKINQNLGEVDWEILELVKIILEPFMKIQQFFEGSKYVTISFIPLMIKTLRDIINSIIKQCTEAMIGARFIQNSEGVEFLTETIEKINQIIAAMKTKFEERWGTGLEGSLFIENQTRGQRNIRKGIPRVAFIAAYIDPRKNY